MPRSPPCRSCPGSGSIACTSTKGTIARKLLVADQKVFCRNARQFFINFMHIEVLQISDHFKTAQMPAFGSPLSLRLAGPGRASISMMSVGAGGVDGARAGSSGAPGGRRGHGAEIISGRTRPTAGLVPPQAHRAWRPASGQRPATLRLGVGAARRPNSERSQRSSALSRNLGRSRLGCWTGPGTPGEC
jgi:hypothetical protein